MWKESNRNIVVIFQPNILRIVGFYVRHSAIVGFRDLVGTGIAPVSKKTAVKKNPAIPNKLIF